VIFADVAIVDILDVSFLGIYAYTVQSLVS